MTANHAHTPTTQTVRKIFADYANMTEVQRKRDKAAFDRWLSEVEAAAEQRGATRALREAAREYESTHEISIKHDKVIDFLDTLADEYRADLLEGDE